MIQLEQVTIEESATIILKNISLLINKKDTVALYGPSGSGKSTLLKMLLGGQQWLGAYTFENHLVNTHNIQTIRNKMAYIPQLLSPGPLIVSNFLKTPFTWAAMKHLTFKNEQVHEYFELLKLSKSLLSRSLSQLSAGQIQRLLIIRALLTERNIVIADEPTSSLDKESSRAVKTLLLSGLYTIISSSHDTQWINQCSRQFSLKKSTAQETFNML